MIKYPYYIKGFTLVELSMVLVIVGLIVAATLGGQAVIHSAKLRNIVTEIGKNKDAIDNFVDQYHYFPGDMPNATTFWPSCTDDGSNTCDGDGDWLIEGETATLFPKESLRAWQHLVMAGITEGDYTGRDAGGTYTGGVNIPLSRFSSAVHFVSAITTPVYQRSGNALRFSGLRSSSTSVGRAVLSPADAYYVDSLMDDGKASEGEIYIERSPDPDSGCTDNPPSSASADFVLNEEVACDLILWLEPNRQ